MIFVSRIKRLRGPLDEIMLFSAHKFSVIMSCRNMLSRRHLIRETCGQSVGCFISNLLFDKVINDLLFDKVLLSSLHDGFFLRESIALLERDL